MTNDLCGRSLLSIMHNLLQLMQTTLKLLWGVGKISQSKLSLQSIIATVTQVNDGLLGTNQASAKCLPAPKSPPALHMNGILVSFSQNV